MVAQFEACARAFTDQIGRLVLRRDKRDDPQISDFMKLGKGDYREVRDLAVSCTAKGIPRDWLRKVCAAEALSMLPQEDQRIKTARLFIAKAHGEFDIRDEDGRSVSRRGLASSPWLDALTAAPPDIHTHPSIQAAVAAIEAHAARGEKVLVFGRFLAPMRALTDLLNAREMLRRLRDGGHWPARGFDRPAALAEALRDPDLAHLGPAEKVQDALAQAYAGWERARKTELARLRRDLEDVAEGAELSAILSRDTGETLHAEVGALLHALAEQVGHPQDRPWDAEALVKAFAALKAELAAGDEDIESQILNTRLERHLQDFSGPAGGFARMLSGDVAADTRRRLQAGFNRPFGAPTVLVAQSLVGREGLNLQESCRTVFLFHAEWNPGVVEQQIGRVDRKNSRWMHDLSEWQQGGAAGDPPRILIRPVVFGGTHDEHNWQVLKARWTDYRAQLHGEVIPHVPRSPEQEALAARVRRATPRFSPLTLPVERL